MKNITKKALRIVHAATLPASGLLLHNSHRTRVLLMVGSEVLLIKTSFGYQRWSLPGGGIKRGEDPRRCAVREVAEETGVKIKSQDLTELSVVRLPKERRWPKQELHFYFIKLPKKPNVSIKRPLEIMEIQWFPLSGLPQDRSTTVDEGRKLLQASAVV